MFILKKKIKKNIYNKYLYFINVKYNKKLQILYFIGKSGLVKIKLLNNHVFNFNKFKNLLNNLIFSLNIGWVSVLFLNGLGYRCTRKITFNKEKYWRFNVGHSHVFQFFSNENVVMKSKTRYICLFSFDKKKLLDLTQKIKTFKKINVYKGSGIHYLDEYKITKSGKLK